MIDAWVPGVLRPAPRPRVANGRAYMPAWYGRQTRELARHFAATMPTMPVAPTRVAIAVLIERPSSHRLKSGALASRAPVWPPARSGDVDNLAKGILDAAVDAGVLPDDSQVVDLRVTKQYAGPTAGPGFWLRMEGANLHGPEGRLVERAGSGRTGI